MTPSFTDQTAKEPLWHFGMARAPKTDVRRPLVETGLGMPTGKIHPFWTKIKTCPCMNTFAVAAATVLRSCAGCRMPTSFCSVLIANPMRSSASYRRSLRVGAALPGPAGLREHDKKAAGQPFLSAGVEEERGLVLSRRELLLRKSLFGWTSRVYISDCRKASKVIPGNAARTRSKVNSCETESIREEPCRNS